MASFLHVFLKPSAGKSEAEVEKVMNLAVDWYKYADYCWVVKTTSAIEKWQVRLKPLVGRDGNLLILAIDPTKRQGWIAKGFWDWLKKAQEPKT
jgi:hypothetical protein